MNDTTSARRGPDLAGLAVGAVLLLTAGIVWRDLSSLTLSSVYGLGPKAMPYVVAIGLVLMAGANVLMAFREGRQERETTDPKALALILGGMAALIASVGLGGGFIPGTTILFAATAAAFGRRAFLIDLAIGLVLALVIFLVFSKLLSLSLPIGPIERLF